jgi:hypothetical protein
MDKINSHKYQLKSHYKIYCRQEPYNGVCGTIKSLPENYTIKKVNKILNKVFPRPYQRAHYKSDLFCKNELLPLWKYQTLRAFC